MKIALAQMQAGSDREANLRRGVEWIAKAGEAGATSICFPELSFLPFFPQARSNREYFKWAESIPGPTLEKLADAARNSRIVVIANVYERTERGDYYNTALVLDADGAFKGAYRMAHIAEGPAFDEKFYYWPGNSGYPVFQTRIGRIGIAICHDRNFPEVFRCLALDGAAIVFVPTVLTASAYREAPGFLDVPQQAASMANGIFTVCVNRVGPGGVTPDEAGPGVKPEKLICCGGSLVTDPFGSVVGRAELDREELTFVAINPADVDEARRRRPYFRDRRPETYGRIGAL